MANGAIAPESVVALPGAAAAAVAWRARGQLHVTVIAKASFAFAPDAEMPRAEPQEIVRAEVHHGNHPLKSVRLTTDLVPFLPQADVVFTGHAHAPPGSTASSVPVRLTIVDGERVVLDKALVVQDSVPFQHLPIVYERALAGADAQENPLGLGGMAGPGEPNVIDPAQPGRPAGFGPIARAWPARKRLLGGAGRAQLDAPILEIPEPFDWSYFQAAPRDQRVGYLRGGEWIVLQGLHPASARLRMRLPAARGLARVYGLSDAGVAEGQPLVLEADTLRIDGEEQRCTVSFRRSFPVPGEAALASVRLVVGVALPGAPPLDWPARFEDLGPGAPDAPPAQGTGTVSAGPASGEAGVAKGQAAAAGGTVVLREDAEIAASAHPFQRAPAPPGIAKSAGPPAPRPGTGTLALSADPAVLVSQSAKASQGPAAFTLEMGPAPDASIQGSPPLPFAPGSPAPGSPTSPFAPGSPAPGSPAPGSPTSPFAPGPPAPGSPTPPLAGVAAGTGAEERRAWPERAGSGTLALVPEAEERAVHERALPFSPSAAEEERALAAEEERALAAEEERALAAEEERALEDGPALPDLAAPARTPSAPPAAADGALGATLLDAPPPSAPLPVAASDAGAAARVAPASVPPPPSAPLPVAASDAGAAARVAPASVPPPPSAPLPVAASDGGALSRAAPASVPPPAPAPPAPPRRPPPPVSLPAPSPDLKRSLYDRFERKQRT